MRKLVAETGNRSAELILDLIYFAEDVSVRLFLDNIFVYDKLAYSDNPKIALITHLFQYMNKYIEMNVTESKEFFELKMRYDENTPDFSSGVPFIEDVYIPLYLHLYALSENYYSYRIITTQSISDVKNSNNICNDSQNNNKGNVSKKGSPAKLLNLLIQSFVHNKFYYCFWGDFLYKIEIKSKIIEKENEETKKKYNEKVATFDFTKYQLKDVNGKTFVINNNIGVKESLDMLLVRNNYCFNVTSNGMVNDASGSISFTDITKVHKKIIKILKYKKYKGAAVSDKNIKKLREQCKDLLNKLKELQDNVNPEVENDYFSVFPKYDFEDLIFKIRPSEAFENMRDFRHDRKNKLNNCINDLEQAIIEEDDEYMYKELLEQINDIKPLIENIFN